jgi:hypothetical protein
VVHSHHNIEAEILGQIFRLGATSQVRGSAVGRRAREHRLRRIRPHRPLGSSTSRQSSVPALLSLKYGECAANTEAEATLALSRQGTLRAGEAALNHRDQLRDFTVRKAQFHCVVPHTQRS